MGRLLVPATMVASLLAFAAAALTVGRVPEHPTWWRAAVALAVLGGVTPMIYAVNIRVIPVFGRRQWRSLNWLRAQVAMGIAGAWGVFFGRMAAERWLEVAGAVLALAGGVTFMVNIARLFRLPATGHSAPQPFPEQATIDRLATRFTRLSGLYLLIGLGIGLLIAADLVETARWDIVWAHAMLVGFFLSMASGVCYHVLSRWTGRRWRSVAPIRLHLIVVAIGLPVMLIALATGSKGLFLIAGPLQAAALALFLATITPQIVALPGWSRPTFLVAAACLAAGIALGAIFAIDPATGARLRQAHAELNLFGWTGFLISGVGYYLVPRFAGRPLRWPRLAGLQVLLLGVGVALGVYALVDRASGSDVTGWLLAAQAMVAAGFALFAVIVAGTFSGRPGAQLIMAPARPAPRSA